MKYIITLILLLTGFSTLSAQEKQLMPYPQNEKVFIYPNNGQSQEQMQEDRFTCYQQAINATGFDPASIPEASSPPPGINDISPQKTPAGFGGSGETPDKGYLAGEAKKEWKTEEIAKYEAGKTEYNKFYKSCLEKRGYTVN